MSKQKVEVPNHIALVMDGNGRWAKERGLPRTAGHEAGEKVLFNLVEAAIGFGVKEISAYAFSTENWKRSPEEVKFLMGYSRESLRNRRDRLHDLGVKVQWIGRPQRLWKSVIEELETAEELTAKNKKFTLNMCVNYGGRAEIVDAATELARDVKRGKVKANAITEKTFAKYLYAPKMSALLVQGLTRSRDSMGITKYPRTNPSKWGWFFRSKRFSKLAANALNAFHG